ncbi:MAG: sodium/solute symporter [Phycisphaeraceae bacterium]|nr:sodium/solute symporter [Phycisphaeraceae bacterium]
MAIYLTVMIAMGWWFAKRQKSTEEFFLAGRKAAWWAIAIGLYISLFSSISFVASPGEGYSYGMTLFLFKICMVLPMPVMLFVFLRFFYNLRLWTAYQYLEHRFDVRIRLLGSTIFLMLRAVYLGVGFYALAIIMEPMTGWPLLWTIVVVGLATTIYTTLGGMGAVIWTDVVQFFVLIAAIGSVIVAVWWQIDGGFVAIWQSASEMGRGFNVGADSGFWDWNFHQRLSLMGWIIGLVTLCIGPATDQVNLQRCMSSKSFRHAALAVVGSSVGSIPISGMFYFAGMCLFVYFNVLHPGTLPEHVKSDGVIAHFATHFLPHGIRGLFLAGVLAASMSTVSSVLNSMAAVTVKDFLERVFARGLTEQSSVTVSRWLTLGWGIMTIIFGILVVLVFADRDIPFLEVANVTLGYFSELMLGVFCLGLLTYRANTWGVIVGTIGGASFTAWFIWVFYLNEPIETRVSFLYMGVVGTLSVIVLGYVLSLFFPDPKAGEKRKYVVWTHYRRHKHAQSLGGASLTPTPDTA